MKYIPTSIVTYFKDIDFVKLYEEGKRIILTDLDNTLVSYYKPDAPQDLIEFNEYLRSLGFKIYIVSNNQYFRVKRFIKTFKVDGSLSHALKPWVFRVGAFLRYHKIKRDEAIFIGDQILTDIKVANLFHIDSILVRSLVRSSEKWYTKMNRKREAAIMKRILKQDPVKYYQIERLNQDNE